jgi:hypothetical protein
VCFKERKSLAVLKPREITDFVVEVPKQSMVPTEEIQQQTLFDV